MGNNSRVEVFRVGLERPLYCVKFKSARELVARGRAEFIGGDNRAIRIIAIEPVAKSSELISCQHQATAYEQAGIEKHRRYVVGGLNRTENQPKPFSIARGARVGH